MSVFKIFTFGAFGLITIMVWRLGIIPPIYDGFVNGVTTLRTHTVYVDGVPTRQAKISSWRIKFPDGIPRTSDGATIFNDFDQRGSGRAGAFWMALASWLKNGSMIYNPTENAKHDFAAEYFAVVVDNMLLEYREFPKLVQRDYCLPNDGIKGRAPCLEGFPSCSISINYHGWNAYATVPRNTLYNEPDLVCGILRKNLDAWTVSIDDLRQPQRGTE